MAKLTRSNSKAALAEGKLTFSTGNGPGFRSPAVISSHELADDYRFRCGNWRRGQTGEQENKERKTQLDGEGACFNHSYHWRKNETGQGGNIRLRH